MSKVKVWTRFGENLIPVEVDSEELASSMQSAQKLARFAGRRPGQPLIRHSFIDRDDPLPSYDGIAVFETAYSELVKTGKA